MVLVVDVGNTDTKFGVFDGEDLRARWAVHSDLNRTGAEHEALLRAMLVASRACQASRRPSSAR